MADFWVNGIVAMRNGMPYVQLSNEKGMIAQLSVSECRQIAMDMLNMAARTECDAMVHKWLREELKAPAEASAGIMQVFRDFRHELDQETAERGTGDMAWVIERTDFGRFIIVKESDRTLAWTGSGVWDKHVGGVSMGEAQIANFDTQEEAEQWARATIFERPE